MKVFPLLKTGAVAQYPLQLSTAYQTEAVRFLDGSRQRYRVRGTALRTWNIRLDLLDAQELSALISFVEGQRGASFAFTDPASGVVAAKCVIGGDRFDAIAMDELRAGATLSIEEIA